MVRVCDGSALPQRRQEHGLPAAHLRRRGARDLGRHRSGQARCWSRGSAGCKDTHKSWWECDTGIAYLVSGAPDWRTRRMTQIYDLSDPANPVKIRDFGLPGQEPGATGAVPTELHGADLDRAAGQPRLFRLRHQQGRHPADRRSREAAEGAEGADAGQSARTRDRRGSMMSALERRAHDLPAAADADRRVRQATRTAASATSS